MMTIEIFQVVLLVEPIDNMHIHTLSLSLSLSCTILCHPQSVGLNVQMFVQRARDTHKSLKISLLYHDYRDTWSEVR